MSVDFGKFAHLVLYYLCPVVLAGGVLQPVQSDVVEPQWLWGTLWLLEGKLGTEMMERILALQTPLQHTTVGSGFKLKTQT